MISLGENVYTTFYFDEDKFGAMNIALIFCFEPILKAVVKHLCEWNSFIYDFVSEGIQCFLFLYFCSYREDAQIILPALMAAQVFLMMVLKVKEKYVDKQPDKQPEDQTDKEMAAKEPKEEISDKAFWKGCNVIRIVFTGLATGLPPLFYLCYQDEAPYRQKQFEVVLTCYYWVAGLSIQYRQQVMVQAVAEPDSIDGKKLVAMAGRIRWPDWCQLAFVVYVNVLAWMYWFSGDMEANFDHVFTMITMVTSCSTPFFACGLCCRYVILSGSC